MTNRVVAMGLKHRMFAAAFTAISAVHADRWLRFLAQGCGLILMLHRVRPRHGGAFAPNRILEITPEFLDGILAELRREGFDIIPIAEVPSRLGATAHRRPFAVLTFDDGYRDNVEHAWPVLRRHKAPWTLFVTTDFADGAGRLWWLELEEAIACLNRVVLPDGQELPARTAEQKQAAFAAIYRRLRAGTEATLRAAVADISVRAAVDPNRLVQTNCLTWDEIRVLAREPEVTIGAHTISHPILSKHDESTAAREITAAKAYLERRLGRVVDHLAYPFGDRSAAGAREFKLALKAGFSTAVTSRPGHLFPYHASHVHSLPRVSVNGLFQSKAALRALLSGVPFLAWNGARVALIES